MLQKIFATSLALVCFITSYSQDSAVAVTEEPATKPLISGSVDVYYRYNFANPKASGMFNNNTSFTNSQNSFELGMASVRLDHSFGKVSVVADLGFGKRAEDFSYNDEKTMMAIKQAYVSYAVSDKLKLSAGSWATHVGYELVDPQLNRNYSMSYMFSYGPFFHTGVKAELSAGKSGFMVSVVNPNDLKTASFQQKMIGAQYSYAASDNWKFYLNYIGGKLNEATNLQQIDAVLLGTITDKFSIGYNGTMQSQKAKDSIGKYGGSDSWWGSAVYLNLDPSPKFGLTLRTEYFDDKKNVLGFEGNIIATTLSANLKAGPLTIIPEFRLENSNRELFVKDSGAGTKSTATALIAAVYRF
jgi:Putative beta-barrel porin-2, OmpL-like. bbp2